MLMEIKSLSYPSLNPFNLFCNSLNFIILVNRPTTAIKKAIDDNTVIKEVLSGVIPYNQAPPAIARNAINFLLAISAFLLIISILSFNSIYNYTIKR